MNFQVLQMIGILLIALAVPLALVAIGVRQFTSKPQPAPETGGLRLALEQAVGKSWQAPEPISDGRGVFLLSSRDNLLQVRAMITDSVRDLGGLVLPASNGPSREERILVQIPASKAGGFEDLLDRNFEQQQQAALTEGSRLYELVLSPR